jgi:uncharacterized protein (TIGR03437 family)
VVTIAGERLTSGSTLFAASTPLPVRLAGTHVEVNGIPAPLFSVSPDSVLAQLPLGLVPGQPTELTVASVNRASQAIPLRIEPAAPEIVAATRAGDVVVVYVLGLGATEPAVSEGIAAPAGPLARTLLQPVVRLEGQPAVVEFSGLAPGLVGVYQVNAALPAGTGAAAGAIEIAIEAAGGSSTFVPAP